MQGFTLLYATDNHTCHLADLALWIFFHDLFHAVDAARCITVVQQTETFDEQELRTVLSQRKAALGDGIIGFDRFSLKAS